ncbi:DUF2939 domain-containing protein [Sediminicoccus sp. KRV36]|uniref:DUF2939 domain-containing protein n=1 Tax=Sediminicoccus sp. KRV36 TaxID=3133721 RepID=UPI00200EFF4C|nr:DUF2939 domain-containing protein [Sediminicoccus rosea]UPY37521.1 DUF2939 domain-containing protein [Sediminicoccus rosea]
MSATTCINTWDDVWAEFDARQTDRSETAQTAAIGVAGAIQTAPDQGYGAKAFSATARLNRLIHARRNQTLPIRRSFLESAVENWSHEAERARQAQAAKRQKPRGMGRFKRTLALMACTLIAVYAGSPVASAVQVAAAIQRGDAAALAHYIDWTTLRPALNAALAAETQRNDSQPMPAFITGMAQDMAERLSSPAGLALLLNERLAAGGAQPARDMLSRVRMLEAGLWEVTLTSPNVPDRSAKLTLALTDAMRLRWEVQAIELPAQLPARFR